MPDAALRRISAVLAAALLGIAAQPAAAWQIAPHQGSYRVELASTRTGSQVAGVAGEMRFRWADACDGWAIEQNYRLDFTYAQGNEAVMSTGYATWESRDGRRFTFSTRNMTGDHVDEELRGSAEMTAAGGPGTATYRLPEPQDMALPQGSFFPTAHTEAILTRAEAGEHLFHALLFDGTRAEGLTELNAVIGARLDAPDPATVSSPLLARPSWRVRLAFFTLPEVTAAPEYEMSVRLYDNGVVDDMTIDYGTFAVRVRLDHIEPLPPRGCG